MELLLVLVVLFCIGAGGLIMFFKGAEWVLCTIVDTIRNVFNRRD